MPKTYNELYLDARRVLRSHGVEAAQLEARELLSYASGKSREQFYRDLPLYPGDHVERLTACGIQTRDTVQKSLCIWMHRMVKEFFCFRFFHKISQIHNTNTVTELSHSSKVMRDKQYGHAQFFV